LALWLLKVAGERVVNRVFDECLTSLGPSRSKDALPERPKATVPPSPRKGREAGPRFQDLEARIAACRRKAAALREQARRDRANAERLRRSAP
jgi:hypothetical protein